MGLAKHLTWLEVKGADHEGGFLYNSNLAPVPPHKRKWTSWTFFIFWWSSGCNISTLQLATTGMMAGLTWWQAFLAVFIGFELVGMFVVLNSRMAAMYHIGFPVSMRTCFGLFGGFLPICERLLMGCVWQGVQAWLGGICVDLMIRSIWPSFNNLHNTLHNRYISTQQLVSFVIFLFFNGLMMLPSPQKIRHLFEVKVVVIPIALFSLLGWMCGGANHHALSTALRASGQLHGSKLAWVWLATCTSSLGNMATLICNSSDFARMANKPSAVIWPQMAGVTFTYLITTLVGVIIAVAAQAKFNEQIWTPLDALTFELNSNPHHSTTRAGVFFIALGWAIITLGVNVSANSLSTGSDLTALLPRWINIRRGQFIALAVGAVYNPWIVLNSSSNFTSVISSFAVFLSSCAGVQFADYYFVARGFVHIPSLYHTHLPNGEKSRYFHFYGVSIKAFISYFAGVAVNLPGFVGVCRNHYVSTGIEHEFTLAYLVGFCISFVVYLLLHVPDFYQHYRSRTPLGWYEPPGGSWEARDWSASIHDIVSDDHYAGAEVPGITMASKADLTDYGASESKGSPPMGAMGDEKGPIVHTTGLY